MKHNGKQYQDGVAINLKARQFFASKPVKNSDMVSFKSAKEFALHVLYTHLDALAKK